MDVLIRGLSVQAVQRIDAEARSLGLSRNELLRRKLEGSGVSAHPEAVLSAADWSRSADAFEDLSDAEVMSAAWR